MDGIALTTCIPKTSASECTSSTYPRNNWPAASKRFSRFTGKRRIAGKGATTSWRSNRRSSGAALERTLPELPITLPTLHFQLWNCMDPLSRAARLHCNWTVNLECPALDICSRQIQTASARFASPRILWHSLHGISTQLGVPLLDGRKARNSFFQRQKRKTCRREFGLV